MKKIMMLTLVALLYALNAQAEKLEISGSISLDLSVPEGWQLADKTPQKLLEIMAEHIRHDAEEKGYVPSEEQLLTAAAKRLSANEALLYNPETLAHMSLDFSPLRQGERAPSEKSVRLSAKYAGESLEQEEGVSELVGKVQKFPVEGAWYAYRYDANYLHHDEKTAFSGIIGFITNNWFYFYYTDYQKDPEDRKRAEEMLKELKIVSK